MLLTTLIVLYTIPLYIAALPTLRTASQQFHTKISPQSTYDMCIQITERYSVCRCLYYRHAVDPCAARAQRGHIVMERTILVGYACSSHSKSQSNPGSYSCQRGSFSPRRSSGDLRPDIADLIFEVPPRTAQTWP